VLDPRKSGNSTPLLIGTGNASAQIKGVVQGPEESEEQRFAREVVNDCLDKGQESIDLG
jgi:hypothetical protein